AHDGVVGAALEEQEAVLVQQRQVGGSDPALLARLGGLNLQDAFAANGQLFTGVDIDHPQGHAGLGTAHGAALGFGELPVVLEVPAGDAAAKLCGPVNVENGNAVVALKPLLQVDRQWGAAGDYAGEAGQGVNRNLGVHHHAD